MTLGWCKTSKQGLLACYRRFTSTAFGSAANFQTAIAHRDMGSAFKRSPRERLHPRLYTGSRRHLLCGPYLRVDRKQPTIAITRLNGSTAPCGM